MNSSFLKEGNTGPASAAAYFCLPCHPQTSEAEAIPQSDHRCPDFGAEDSLKTLPHCSGLMCRGISSEEPSLFWSPGGKGNSQFSSAEVGGSACLVQRFCESCHLIGESTGYT